jgi:thiol-disulfide isomerase/thioredoxin
MNWKLAAIVVSTLVVIAGVAYAFNYYYGSKSQGFQNPTLSASPPSAPTFTMCHAEWCGHCKTAMPEFDNFAADGKVAINGQDVVLRKLEATANAAELAGLSIRGYPTFILQTTDGKIAEYRGPRTADGYLAFLNESLGGTTA